jgi:nucleotide-binding universal stress UspA family protein
MDGWLREFVERHRTAQAAEDLRAASLLAAAGGMRLYGTIGADVFLRPDGSTIALVEGGRGEPDRWVVGTEADRIADLVIGAERHPELARLLPSRPPSAADCTACGATGRIHGIVCAACSGLGWTNRAAT